MYDDEGLCLWVELTLRDGVPLPGDQVAQVVLRLLRRAQGEPGHDAGVVQQPLIGGGPGSRSHTAVV